MTSDRRTGSINKRIQYSSVISLIILVGLVLFLSAINRKFLTLDTLINIMSQMSSLGIVALGAMVVITSGGIDFTAGYGLSMIAMAAGTITLYTSNFLVFIVMFILVGFLLGLLNGLIITRLRVLPFIATFAVMSLAQGVALFINNGNMVLLSHPLVRVIGHGKTWGIPNPFWIYLLVAVVTLYLMNMTKFGTYTYAIGSNEEASKNTGIHINKVKMLIYIFAGICTGIASLLTVTRVGMVTPNISGTILIDGIAATCIGGTSMTGGKGSVIGTMIGTVIIVLITIALTYLNIPAEFQNVFKGGVILIAVIIDAFANKTALKD